MILTRIGKINAIQTAATYGILNRRSNNPPLFPSKEGLIIAHIFEPFFEIKLALWRENTLHPLPFLPAGEEGFQIKVQFERLLPLKLDKKNKIPRPGGRGQGGG